MTPEPVTYTHAAELRDEAERTGSAELYRQAAAEFRALGMPCNAAQCDRKAEHYEALDAGSAMTAPRLTFWRVGGEWIKDVSPSR